MMLLVAASVCAGCAVDTRESADEGRAPDEAYALPTTSIQDRTEAPAEELAAADKMLDEAMQDGLMTAKELEALALETVECVKRAGHDANLSYFNAETRSFGFGYRTVDQTGDVDYGKDQADRVWSWCDAAFFMSAWDAFEETNPRSEDEVKIQQQQREQAVLDCMRKSDFEFETIDDFIASEGVPSDVRLACTQAYNE